MRRFVAGAGMVTVALERDCIAFQTYNRTIKFYGPNYDGDPFWVTTVWAADLLHAAEGGHNLGVSSARAEENLLEVKLDNVAGTRRPVKTLNQKGHTYRLQPEPALDKTKPWFGVSAPTAAVAVPKFLHALHPKHWVCVAAEADKIRLRQEYEDVELVLTIDRYCGECGVGVNAHVAALLYIFCFPHVGGTYPVEVGQDSDGFLAVRYDVPDTLAFSCWMSKIQPGKRRAG